MKPPPEINPPPRVQASAEVRVEELGQLAQRFAQTAQRLPGRTPDEHRAAMQQAFADLVQILPVLYGPTPTGMQRQQLRIIDSARTQLGSRQGLAPEPTIDTALRAARDSLQSLGRGSFFDKPELGQTLDKLDARVDALDTVRGPGHQQLVAQVVDLMSAVVTQMAQTLNERINDRGPATQAGRTPS